MFDMVLNTPFRSAFFSKGIATLCLTYIIESWKCMYVCIFVFIVFAIKHCKEYFNANLYRNIIKI